MIASSTLPCVAHTFHRPRPAYTELHHVVPQSWQAFWRPHWATSRLWVPETTPLCPTGHRNIHVLIVRAMKAVQLAGVDDPLIGWKALRWSREAKIAYRALTGFRQEGGSLLMLCEAGLFGS